MSTWTSAVPQAIDAFQAWWQQKGRWVEAPNIRRGGQSGVQLLETRQGLLYSKRQTGHVYRSLRHPFGEPTILREARAYQSFGKLGVLVPEVVFYGARKMDEQWQAILVTHALDGFVDMGHWYQQGPTLQARKKMLNALARTLYTLHQARWQHGCLYAKHIFVRSQGDVLQIALLDLEKCRQRLWSAQAKHHDLDKLARHKGPMPIEDFMTLLAAYDQAGR